MLRRKFVGFPSLFTVLRLSIFGWQALRLLAFRLGGATGCSRSVWRIGVDEFGGGNVASFRGFEMVSLVFCNFAQVQRIGWVAIKDLE